MERRFIVVTLVIGMLIPVPISNASPNGCPKDWQIPQNLMEATPEQVQSIFTPDFNTVVRPARDSQYSFDGLKWITTKNSRANIQNFGSSASRNHDVDVLMKYFNSKWDDSTFIKFGDLSWLKQRKIFLRDSIAVTKQGCGSPTVFYYEKEYVPPGTETVVFEDEMAKIKDRFQNYQLFDSAKAKYYDCLRKWNSYNTSIESKKPIDNCFLSEVAVNDTYALVRLIPDGPGCLEFLQGNSNRSAAIGIKQDSSCTYSILGFKGENFISWISVLNADVIPTYYNVASDKMVFFGNITINTKSQFNTITCIKGKVTKKVTAVSPKCPAGYKKK
jgi:hypothetical protein